jgi:hypothetical protein
MRLHPQMVTVTPSCFTGIRQLAYMNTAMYRWRISFMGKVGRSLGTSDAPTEALARKEAIDFYRIPPSQQFMVVAVQVVETKKPAKSKERA